MQTITIKGDSFDLQVVQAIKAIMKALNPNYEIEYDGYENYEITKADKADMQEILAQRERGELEYVTIDEIDAHVQNIISKRQVNENRIHA